MYWVHFTRLTILLKTSFVFTKATKNNYQPDRILLVGFPEEINENYAH